MLLALILPPPALACGGMFCDTFAPVDQAAERIVFGWEPDGDDGIVTVQVQIAFEGQSDDFAWVVPVPGEPELFVSNDALFTVLANGTVPSHPLLTEVQGSCSTGRSSGGSSDIVAEAAPSADASGGYYYGGERVTVVSSETVGPYETVVLQATSETVLLTWLQDQGYGIPDGIEPVVRPYVADDQYFVALKLSADKDTGDLAPLGMRYRGSAASIPIQLTSIAATPDLPIEVFVFGPGRAVPDNYLHVTLNDAAIDWYEGGTNYREVVSRAVDEAGGQAFVTDYAGAASLFQGRLWVDWWIDTDTLSRTEDPIQWLEMIVFSGMPPSSQLVEVLTRYVPPPEGVDATTFLSCPGCYEVDVPDFDPLIATAALELEVLDVLEEMQAMVDGADHLTRLFTTMDPSEMTVDPLFVFNADVSQSLDFTHLATNVLHCGWGGVAGRRTLVLADGREIELPSDAALEEQGVTELEYMAELTSPAAILIEDLSAEGAGTVIFDYREQAAKDAEQFNAGCGCASAPSASAGVALLGVLALRRRRR